MMRTWLQLALYSSHPKYIKERKQETVWVWPALSKRKVLTYSSSVPYFTVELLHPCPQHTTKGPPCAEISLQVVKRAKKDTSSSLPTGDGTR
jgi:hypothetical protein